jgi:hypothetical protein
MILFYSPSCWWTWIKKMRSTNPELQDWERSFFCLITVVLILVFINSKPIIGEYIVLERLSIYQSIGKVLLNEYMVPLNLN